MQEGMSHTTSNNRLKLIADEDKGERLKFKDVHTLLQDFICSEGLGLLEKEEKVANRLEKDENLEIYYQFILAPDKIPVNTRARRRFAKYENLHINIIKKKVYNEKNMAKAQKLVTYVPDKHNAYYFRSEKAANLLFLRGNYKVLKKVNPRHVDIFYSVLVQDCLVVQHSRVDMNLVFKIIQYFILQSPTESIKNIVKYHIIYELLAHCEVSIAAETLIALLTPGDNFFKLEDKDRRFLSEYLSLVNFGDFLVRMMDNFSVKDIYKERSHVSSNMPDVKSHSQGLEQKMGEPSEKSKNSMLSYFYFLFNKVVLTKMHRQPEDIYTRIMNIDMLPNQRQPRSTSMVSGSQATANSKRLLKSTTIGNLDSIYDRFDGEDLMGEDAEEAQDKVLIEQFNARARRGSINLDLPLNADGYLTEGNKATLRKGKKSPKSKRSKIFNSFKKAVKVIMVNNLFLFRPQKKTQLKNQRRANYNAYPENQQQVRSTIRESGAYKSDYLDKCQKNEDFTSCLSNIIFSIVDSAVLQKTHGKVMSEIRVNTGSISLLTKPLFTTDNLLIALLRHYLSKMPFAFENKELLDSAYYSLKAFLVIAKEV